MWSNNALHGWGVGWIGDRHDGIVVVGGESKFHGRVAIAICLLVLLLRNERMVHCLSWMCRFSILAGPRGIVHVGLRFSPETTHSPRQIHDQKISCATRIVVGIVLVVGEIMGVVVGVMPSWTIWNSLQWHYWWHFEPRRNGWELAPQRRDRKNHDICVTGALPSSNPNALCACFNFSISNVRRCPLLTFEMIESPTALLYNWCCNCLYPIFCTLFY